MKEKAWAEYIMAVSCVAASGSESGWVDDTVQSVVMVDDVRPIIAQKKRSW
jgi:hypothetical protein